MNSLISYVCKLKNKFHLEIKYGVYIRAKTALGFKLNLEVITGKDIFQKKFSATRQKSYDLLHPHKFCNSS